MKDFKKFLEEVDIKGNPGIPGENGKKDEKPYLSDIEKRAKDRLGIRPQDLPRMGPRGPIPSEKEMRLGRKLVQELLPISMKLTSGKEKEFSELATDIIYNLYKDIIDRYNIELDIKLVKPGKIKDFMDESEDSEQPPKFRKITDENTIKEIQKRKIANLVIQGEAKNTKHVLHSEEVKEGFNEILGEEKGKVLFNTLDELTKTADQLDWIIPEEIKADMMEQMPDGLAGDCHVDWKPKKKNDDDDEKEYKEDQDEEEYTEEEHDEPRESTEETPVIRARGIDFSMLLHESVKGIFEFLSLVGLPVVRDEDNNVDKEKTKELLQKIYANTGLEDEPQDFKYGPEIASDIRDFVNVNPKIDTYPNIREELWKAMIDKKAMPTDMFLELIKGILSKTEQARIKVDALINQIIEKIKNEKDYNDQMDQYNSEMEEYNKKMEEYNRKMKEWEEKKKKGELEPAEGDEEDENDVDKLVKKSLYGGEDEKEEEPKDYREYLLYIKKKNRKEVWTKILQDEMDAALDAGDFEKAKIIQPLMEGQSKDLYKKELEIINEGLNLHTK